MAKTNLPGIMLTALVLSHLILFFTVGDPAATFAPALVLGTASAIHLYRNPPRSWAKLRPMRVALACLVLMAATISSFYFQAEEMDTKLFIARAMLADVSVAMIGVFLSNRILALRKRGYA